MARRVTRTRREITRQVELTHVASRCTPTPRNGRQDRHRYAASAKRKRQTAAHAHSRRTPRRTRNADPRPRRPAGGTFDDAGDFDRVLSTNVDLCRLLQYVDPYGNTVFNAVQMSAVLDDLDRLLATE